MSLASCNDFDLNCYALSEAVLGYLNWLGFLIGAIGLGVALYQIFKIRSASDAVKLSIGRLTNHVDSVNLAYLSAQIAGIIHIVQANNLALAENAFAPIKRSLRLYAKSIALDTTEEAAVNRTVARIDKQIQWGVAADPKFDAAKTKRYIDDLLSKITEWEGKSATRNKEGIIDEDD